MHESTMVPSCPVQLSDPVRGYLRRGPAAVRAARRARVGASLALLTGFAVLVVDAVKLAEVPALVVVAATWCAAIAIHAVLYVAARLGAPAVPAAMLARELGPGSASERNALVLPLVAIALVAPLSIHAAVFVLLGWGSEGMPLVFVNIPFDNWVGIWLLMGGNAHVVLAVLVARDGIKLVEDRPDVSARRTLMWTIGASAVPVGILFFAPHILMLAIPPILTAFTGLALIPAMYAWARATVLAERARLTT